MRHAQPLAFTIYISIQWSEHQKQFGVLDEDTLEAVIDPVTFCAAPELQLCTDEQ